MAPEEIRKHQRSTTRAFVAVVAVLFVGQWYWDHRDNQRTEQFAHRAALTEAGQSRAYAIMLATSQLNACKRGNALRVQLNKKLDAGLRLVDCHKAVAKP